MESHYICPFRYRLVLCLKKFTKHALTLTTQKSPLARDQFKLEPHPHWSPLGVNLNFPTSIPVTFTMDPPGGELLHRTKNTLTFISSTLFALAKQSKNLGAYKMARTTYDKLQVMWIFSRKKSQKSAKRTNSFSWGSEKNSTLWKYKANWFYFSFSRFIFAVIEDPSTFSRIHWPRKCHHSFKTLPWQRGVFKKIRKI